jgi:hypothetical protein
VLVLLILSMSTWAQDATNTFTPKNFGAKGDTKSLSDGAMTSGSAAFTSSSATFSAADVGKAIVVTGAAASGNALVTTIQTFTSVHAVSLTATANTTVAGALTYYGSDDAAAVRSCVQQGTMSGGRCTISYGLTFMMSNTSTAIFISGTVAPGGILDGSGTIICAPQGSLSNSSNNRCLYLASTESTNPLQVAAGAIAKGATSFSAQNVGDAANLHPNDWVLVTERDSVVSDNVYADWVRVASVSGTLVTLLTQFSTRFPNARTWSTTNPPVCTLASPCGLGFRRVTNVIQNVTIRDINLIVPKIFDPASGNHVVGIATRDTRGVTIEKITCTNASQNCYGGYMDQGLTFIGNHNNGSASTDEFASQVGTKIIGNDYSELSNLALGLTKPQPACIEIDLGSAFFTVTGNSCDYAQNGAFEILTGSHDGALIGNTATWIYGNGASGSGVVARATYRLTITGNTFAGGDGGGIGISFGDSSGFNVNIQSDSNQAWNNTVNGFNTSYDCATPLGTDNCFDPTQTPLKLNSRAFANLGSPANGSITYCSNCVKPAAAGSSCSAAGNGALAVRNNGSWFCY